MSENLERLDHFMARANAAYYATANPFADFTTAPEISQIFGELLGAWACVVWQQLGRPDPVRLIEAGPGRGTLMQDALRSIVQVAPDFGAALRVHLVETSPRLRAEQAARVPNATWHARLEDVPPGPAILIANEFLDALPIRQFVCHGGIWSERHVAGASFVDLPCAPAAADLPDGAVIEHGEAAAAWTSLLAARLVQHGGAALITDYGDASPDGSNTLQALRDGSPVHPLVTPGTADLTAHVDFAAVAEAAAGQGAHVLGPVTQGDFLRALGAETRIERLASRHPDRASALRDAAARLLSPNAMGTLFKVLALSVPQLPLPGF